MKKGFTLLEIIIALFMFTSVALAVTAFTAYYFQNYSFSFEEDRQIVQAQSGLSSLIRYIREARSGEDGSWPIIDATDTTFTFYSDVTNDGRTDRVRYFLEGTNLKRGVIEPTAVPVTYPTSAEVITYVATSVDMAGQPIFRYYNGGWPSDMVNNPLVLSDRLLKTQYIEVRLRINIIQGKYAAPYELQTGVQIRSLKNNL